MAHSSALPHRVAQRRAPARGEHTQGLEQDHGPWLFLFAPVSMALTIIVISWLALAMLP